jgi:hypothetical protein
MMEKIARALTISTIADKIVVYAPAERVDTLPLFLYPCMYLYIVCAPDKEQKI